MGAEGLPRSIDVLQFANARVEELHELSKALNLVPSSGEAKPLELVTPRHQRRRSKSHNRHKKLFVFKKKKNAKNDEVTTSDVNESEPKLCRRLRRRNMLKGASEGLLTISNEGNRLLESHLWHAKRFRMEKKWGHLVAESLPGKGKHSRSVIKWLQNDCLLHDASYNMFLQLSGPKESINAVLRKVGITPGKNRVNSKSTSEEDFLLKFESGAVVGEFMVHEIEKFPKEAISPALVLWRPQERDLGGKEEIFGGNEGEVGGQESTPARCHLLIGVHPSAWVDCLGVFREACLLFEEEMEQKFGEKGQSFSVLLREIIGEFNTVELWGPQALKVLRKVLKNGESKRKIFWAAKEPKDGEDIKNSENFSWELFEGAENLPAGTVLSLKTKDPRDSEFHEIKNLAWKIGETAGNQENLENLGVLKGENLGKLDDIEGGKSEENGGNLGNPQNFLWEEGIRSCQVANFADCSEIWEQKFQDFEDLDFRAENQKEISERRKEKREKLISGKLEEVFGPNLEEKSKFCNLLLIKVDLEKWIVLIPWGWLKAFWVNLVNSGGHVIGQTERRWVNSHREEESFPFDFPQTCAFAQTQWNSKIEKKLKWEKKPKSKRESEGFFPPNWGKLLEDSPNFPPREETLRDLEDLHKLGFWVDRDFSVLQSSVVSNEEKSEEFGTCLVKIGVEISPNRRGNLEEGIEIFEASEEDFELFLKDSTENPNWNGPKSKGKPPNQKHILTKAQKRKREKKNVSIAQNTLVSQDQIPETNPRIEPQNFRKLIGFITSAAPPGSSRKVGIGFILRDSLNNILKTQSEKLEDKHRFLALVKSTASSIYRPILVKLGLD